MRRSSPPAREESDAAVASALARTRITQLGFGPDEGTTVTHVLPGECGGLHVTMGQTFRACSGISCAISGERRGAGSVGTRRIACS